MIKEKFSANSKISTNYYQQRVAFCVKVFRNILRFAGTVLIITQLVKAFIPPFAEGVDADIVITSALGILFLVISNPLLLDKIIAKLAARSRSRIPILFAILILWAKIKIGYDSLSWSQISGEGGLSEYGTAIAYLLIAIFAYPIARQFWRQSQKLLAYAYFLLTFGSFFVSMEEISWGQRLIGFEEPEFWTKHNAQSEFTFHNLSFFHEHFLNQSFIVVGFLGSFSWIVLYYWQNRRQQPPKIDLGYILPSWSISSFFYPTLIFYIIHVYFPGFDFFITKDQEHCEFIMSLGILVFAIANFFRQAKEHDAHIRE